MCEKQLFTNKKVVQKKQPLEVSQDQLVLPASENRRYNCSSQLLRREGMIRREQLAAKKETYVRSRYGATWKKMKRAAVYKEKEV